MKYGRRHDEVEGLIGKRSSEIEEIANLESDVREVQAAGKFAGACNPLFALVDTHHPRFRIQGTVEARQDSVITTNVQQGFGLWESFSKKPTQEFSIHLVAVL
jgi:hypothetical protein